MTKIKPQITTFVFTLSPEDPGTWQHTFDSAIAADRAGFDRVALTGEHVCFGENLDAYADPKSGGRVDGKQATGSDGHYLEPVVTMSTIAALTKNVRFIPNIMLSALRRPVVLAKMLSTLDVLSNGRVDLGIGVGWQKEEYQAAGIDFAKRGYYLDQSLEVCQLLWSEQRASYSSEDLSFENIHMMPKPVQQGGVPFWVSGTVAKPGMRRLARFGAGWIPWGPATQDIDLLVEEIKQMRDMVASFGRDPSDIQVAGSLPLLKSADGQIDLERSIAAAPALYEAGITDFRIGLPIPKDIAAAEDYLTPWVQAFRAAMG